MRKILALLLTLLLTASVFTFATAEAASLTPAELTIMFHGSNVTDDSAVLAKVNEYLKDKINASLKVIWGTWGDFDETSTMSLNAGDPIDMYFTCSWSQDEYNAYAKKGMWVRLDDPDNNLIEKYAADLWATLPQVLTDGAKIQGSDGLGVYAVPGYKDIATQNCWDINVDLLTKYGYTLDDIRNADYYSFGDILKTVKAGEGDSFYPLLVEGMVLERMATNSIIVAGDSGSTNLLSYYMNPTDISAEGPYGNVMLNKFATDEYKKFVEKTREYYLAGYIDPGLAVADTANDLRKNKQLTGQYLIGTQSYSLGYELQASQERNIHVEMVPCTPAYVDTTSSQGAMVAISTASANPERAMMFLNLLNTDPYLMMLLNYGVEGIHYTLNADGLVQFTDKRADYQPWTNGMGNVTLLTPTADQGKDFWDTFKAYYGAAKKIPIIGFTFDASNVQVEQSALVNVAAEYALALDTGAVDPAEKLPEFLQKLSDAGMQTYVDEANAQLTAFLAAQ
ncbi:MAG: ABC transporter substrate-binding protein [Clostridiales bacterium]|nr:ABC transporter substrate-binding protein [Clostridiales bacterium]